MERETVAVDDFANAKCGHSELMNAPNRPNIIRGIWFLVTELSILATSPSNWGGWSREDDGANP